MTRHRFLSQLGFGGKTGIDIEGELTGVLPSREWKRQRFAGKEYREEHRKWYLGDTHLRRHRAGLQRVHADSARIRDRHRSRTMASRSGRIWCRAIRNVDAAKCAQMSRRSPPDNVAVKPEHLAVIKNALAGVTKEGTSATAFAKAAVRERRQDRHRAGVLAQGGEILGQQGRRAPARPCVVHRLRAGRPPRIALAVLVENGGFGAQAAAPIARQGIRLLPGGRNGKRARRRRYRSATPKTRATDAAPNSCARLWELADAAHRQLSVRRAR